MKLDYKKKKINGLQMSFCIAGEKKNSCSSNVLFLHGFPELSYSFRYLMTDLASKGMYCIAPDQRGYGKTTYISAKEKLLSKFSVLNLTKDIFFFITKFKC